MPPSSGQAGSLQLFYKLVRPTEGLPTSARDRVITLDNLLLAKEQEGRPSESPPSLLINRGYIRNL